MTYQVNYKAMEDAMAARALELGFAIGTAVMVKKRAGVVSGFNAFFYSDPDPAVYVDFSAQDRRNLIRCSALQIKQGGV